MRNFLTDDQVKILVQSLVISSLDYCNGIYLGCNQSIISQLQIIQNRACRVIFGLKQRDSVCAQMKDLHWLKVRERIDYKILLTVYKALNGLAPMYLTELKSHTVLLVEVEHLPCIIDIQ